jgi:Ca2+-binding EF-hand superfamily protein
MTGRVSREGGFPVASEQDRQELKDKVAALVRARFGGDYQSAFRHYDADHDGKITKGELKTLLVDAGVGNVFTRPAWAGGIIEELDRDDDACVSWDEFDAAFVAGRG